MDGIKYTVPSLPDTQHILEDLADHDIIKSDSTLDFSPNEETLKNAYTCYLSHKQLESDMDEQSEYRKRLEELNKLLIENIENMKGQTKTS